MQMSSRWFCMNGDVTEGLVCDQVSQSTAGREVVAHLEGRWLGVLMACSHHYWPCLLAELTYQHLPAVVWPQVLLGLCHL